MIKYRFFFAIMMLIALMTSPLNLTATATTTQQIPVTPAVPFVLIVEQNTILYSYNDDTFTAITTIPQSYYCTLISEANETYYEVTYYDTDGFIKKSDSQIVDYEPVTKFCLGTLTISIDSSSVNLRSSPDHTEENIVASANNLQTLSYYGTCVGTIPMLGIGDTWYYVKAYDEQTSQTINCYVYSAYVTATAIAENDLEMVMYTPEQETYPEISIQPLSSTTNIVIIALLCTPTVIVMFLLSRKGSRSLQKKPRFYR